VQTG